MEDLRDSTMTNSIIALQVEEYHNKVVFRKESITDSTLQFYTSIQHAMQMEEATIHKVWLKE